MMNGYDRIIVATSYILYIMENPKWQWLKYIRVYLSCKRSLEVANPELVWWFNGGAPSVFLFCSTSFQLQSHLEVQYGSGAPATMSTLQVVGRMKRKRNAAPRWTDSRSLLRSPIQHPVSIFWPDRIPLVFELECHWIYKSIWAMLASLHSKFWKIIPMYLTLLRSAIIST